MISQKVPVVALVGRMNVGKSTLFNRLIDNKKSLVFNRPGVTRDYISEIVTWQDKAFELIDTGGIPLKPAENDFISQAVKDRALSSIENADFILFVVDLKSGLVDEDRAIAKILHKSGKSVLLVLNKADNKASAEENTYDFLALGFEDMLSISAEHGMGIAQLLNKIVESIQMPEAVDIEPKYKIALIGRPNVGKSSLMNLLLKKERSIVSPVAGTTREAVSEKMVFHKEPIELIDTAGVRRSKKIDDSLEELMVQSSLRAVRDADIVVLVVDVSAGKIADQELKLLFYAYENKKGIVVVFNKTDLIDEEQRKAYEYDLQLYDFIFKKIEQVWISCVSKKNVYKVLDAVDNIWNRYNQEFKSSEIDRQLQESLIKKPLYSTNQLIKVFKIRYVKARVPTFILHVSEPKLFGESHLGFIENQLRSICDLKGCPIQLVLKKV